MRALRAFCVLLLTLTALAVGPAGAGPAGAAPAAATATGTAGSFVPVAGLRVLDTRLGAGTPVAPHAAVRVKVAGVGQVPADASAVSITVTVTQGTAAGYLSVYPDGRPWPGVSNLNFSRNQDVPNQVLVAVGAGGSVDVLNGSAGSAHVIVDLGGYFTGGTAPVPGGFGAMTPARVLDTRIGLGAPRGPVPAGGTVRLKVAGAAGVPAGITAVALNLTATQAQAAGYVAAYPADGSRPGVSNLNLQPGRDIANAAVVPVSADGYLTLLNASNGGTTQLVADVDGYFTAGGSAQGGFVPVAPQRIVDTRTCLYGRCPYPVPGGSTVPIPVTGVAGVPAGGVRAVVLTVTVTQPQGAGYLSVFPHRASRPATSAVNFTAGQDVADLVVVPVGGEGRIDLVNGSPGSTHLVVDIAGYLAGPAFPAITWSQRQLVDPPSNTWKDLSCPSPDFCAAIDSFNVLFDRSGTWQPPARVLPDDSDDSAALISCSDPSFCLVLTATSRGRVWDGAGWSDLPGPFPASETPTSLSCVSASFCAASDNEGWYSLYRGEAGWSEPQRVTDTSGVLTCRTSDFCLLADAAGRMSFFNGTAWTAPQTVAAGYYPLHSVTCATATSCDVSYGNADYHWDGSAWGDPVRLGGGAGLAVSCTPDAGCLAVTLDGMTYVRTDTAWQQLTANGPPVTVAPVPWRLRCAAGLRCVLLGSGTQAVSFDGQSWGSPAAVNPARGTPDALSCTSASFCIAVDATGHYLRYDGTAWSAPEQIAASLRSVSCAGPNFCLAGGANGTVLRWDGTGWSGPVTAVAGAGDTLALSCPGTGFCLAVAPAADGTGTLFATYTAGGWSATGPVGQAVDSLSCVSATFCMASSASAGVTRFDGHAWTPGPNFGLADVSCTSPAACVAVGGSVSTSWDGTRWSAFADLFDGLPGSVSCVGDRFCLAAGDRQVLQFNGIFWAEATAGVTGYGPRVSCVPGFCAVIDRDGRVATGQVATG